MHRTWINGITKAMHLLGLRLNALKVQETIIVCSDGSLLCLHRPMTDH